MEAAEFEVMVACERPVAWNPKFLTSALLRLGSKWWWKFEADDDELDEDELDEIDDGTAAADAADATLCCGIEVCRIRFSMKDSAVAFPTVEEEEDISVFSSEVDNGPIDEMCELQGKSICNLKKKHRFKKTFWILQ